MSIKLKGATSGSVSLDVPAAVSGGDVSLTLPNGVGSAGQYLKNSGTAGELEFGDLPAATPTAGQIIEQLEGICDGRQVTVGSGTYTLPTVTHGQLISTTYVDLSGSSFSYTPPSNTNTLVFDYEWAVAYYSSSAPLLHAKLFLDSTEVTVARNSTYMYYDGRMRIRCPFTLNNATEDIANAKIGTWNTSKTFKISIRAYSATSNGYVHQTVYWDGTTNRQDTATTLSITAIA